MPEPDPRYDDATLLFDAVREAGALALTMLRQQIRRWVKSDGSPVTEADLAVDALLAAKLRNNRPSYGWLSEESQTDTERMTRHRAWVVDPIDGTRAFSDGGREWCVAAALVEDGRPVVACLYQPVTERFYTATQGHGAHLNGQRLAVKPGRGLKGARFIGTRKLLGPLAAEGIEADVSRSLPLQLRLAEVASGRAAGAVSMGLKNDWDLAAGDLLVHEAGGLASDLAGKVFQFNRRQPWQNGMVAASPRRHAAVLRRVGTP